jgi:antitoxin HigA-1
MHNPAHPGKVLKDILDGIPMTVTEFAAHIGVARVTLSRVLNEKAGVSAEMSIRISQAFKKPPDLWFRMQNAHDFWQASQGKRKKIHPLKVAA